MDVNLDNLDGPKDAAHRIAEGLREYAQEVRDYDEKRANEEIVVWDPEYSEFGTWEVVWEGGPYNWTHNLLATSEPYETPSGFESPEADASITDALINQGILAEPGRSFTLCFSEA